MDTGGLPLDLHLCAGNGLVFCSWRRRVRGVSCTSFAVFASIIARSFGSGNSAWASVGKHSGHD
eukprot:3492840-Pyramimonas_sp.AAC.1